MTQPADGPDQPHPGSPSESPSPKKRRGGLVTIIVLAGVLLLCGGGGVSAYRLLRNADGQGADDPKAAVIDFLEAVYTQQDPRRAAQLICSESRDQDIIAKKIDEIRKSVRGYRNPRFSWDDPRVEDESSDRARVSAKIILTTGDDQVAEQELSLTVVRKTGWWVCEVEPK
jgi:hypothetical protein